MDIAAVVGARSASQLIAQDDWVIIDGDAGVVIVDPSPIILAEYGFKQRQGELERGRLQRLLHTSAVTMDGEKVQLLANIEMPEDAAWVRYPSGALAQAGDDKKGGSAQKRDLLKKLKERKALQQAAKTCG